LVVQRFQHVETGADKRLFDRRDHVGEEAGADEASAGSEQVGQSRCQPHHLRGEDVADNEIEAAARVRQEVGLQELDAVGHIFLLLVR
jgi:hypothetical protein